MWNNRGNTLIAIALAGGMILFVSSFVNASLRALNTSDSKGSVQGVFVAQRATLTPEPSPYFKVNISQTTGGTTGLPGGTVCGASWGGSPIATGRVVTNDCKSSPANSFTVPYNSWGPIAGVFIKIPPGWTFNGAGSPDNEGDFVTDDLIDETNTMGKAAGIYRGQLPLTGSTTINLYFKPPVSPTTAPTAVPAPLAAPANLVATCGAENKTFSLKWDPVTNATQYAVVISYEPYDFAHSRNTDTATTTSYSSYTYWNSVGNEKLHYRATVKGVRSGQTISNTTGLPATVDFYCPYPPPSATPTSGSATPTPPAGCQYIAEACTNSIPPNCVYKLSCVSPKPTCAKNCALQPKGDASCNLVVDSEDYTIWRNNLDKNVGVGTSPKEGPDFNNDGKVNLTDLQKWQDGLFTPPPTPAGACAVPTSDVKPTSALPTLGPGCTYKQVQCIQAPCPPIVVCPTTAVTAPAGAATPTNAPVASWSIMTTGSAPNGRFNHLALWTGSKMLVYGGTISNANIFAPDPGYLYDPVANTWTSMTTTGTPGGSMGALAGNKFIVYGGSYDLLSSTLKSTGGIYDIASNTWTAMNLTNAPAGKRNATMVSTGSKVILWGGYTTNSGTPTNTGAIFDPATNTWTAMSTTNAPNARAEHTAVWTGSKMIVYGGINNDIVQGGGIYDPATNTWAALPATGAPTARYGHTATWTGSKMIIWGGLTRTSLGSQDTNEGGIFNPATNTWTATETSGAPTARDFHTAVWSGTKLIVWGGAKNINSQFYNDGGIFDPEKNIWSALPANANISGRNWHSAVWTGSKMIIWGGATATSSLNTGAIYSP